MDAKKPSVKTLLLLFSGDGEEVLIDGPAMPPTTEEVERPLRGRRYASRGRVHLQFVAQYRSRRQLLARKVTSVARLPRPRVSTRVKQGRARLTRARVPSGAQVAALLLLMSEAD